MLFKTPLWHSRWGKQLHPHRAVCREGSFQRLKKDARSISKAKPNPTQLQASARFNMNNAFSSLLRMYEMPCTPVDPITKAWEYPGIWVIGTKKCNEQLHLRGKENPHTRLQMVLSRNNWLAKSPKIIIALRRLEMTGVTCLTINPSCSHQFARFSSSPLVIFWASHLPLFLDSGDPQEDYAWKHAKLPDAGMKSLKDLKAVKHQLSDSAHWSKSQRAKIHWLAKNSSFVTLVA